MDIAHEISLIVCKSCEKSAAETEVEFSTRLYETYCNCLNNVQSFENEKDKQQCENSYTLKF